MTSQLSNPSSVIHYRAFLNGTEVLNQRVDDSILLRNVLMDIRRQALAYKVSVVIMTINYTENTHEIIVAEV